VAFLDELISPFMISGAPTDQTQFSAGQVFKATMYYPHQRLELWRPNTVHQQLHTARDFNIVSSAKDAFDRPVPYSNPALKTNEEFIALKAKWRPVIMIQPPDPSLSVVKSVSMGIKLERHLCIVAPAFGLSDSAGYARASTEFLERVRKLEYPQFLFLPKGGPLVMDSLLRLDEIQSVVVQNLVHTGYSLAPEALSVFRSQVGFYMGGNVGGEFQDYRDLLASE